MFEEDFERCFICQTPCKGLYCSSECRLQDKGTPAEPAKATAPIRLTAKLPDALSPLVRPTYHISPSPRMPAQADNSSSSSISSSPLQSPRTMPSGTDSPQKDIFDLPPPAFPPNSLTFPGPGPVPVKIPALAKAKPAPTASPAASAATIFPGGASIETLRFGRKPGQTNSVTSPNALLPRCACGLPANHRDRPSSKDRNRDIDATFHLLSLGPAVVGQSPREKRIKSDGHAGVPIDRKVSSGHVTPSLVLSSSYLSRSRSDPAPGSPRNGYRHSLIAPTGAPKHSLISPSRRASAAAADAQAPAIGLIMSRTVSQGSTSALAAPPAPAAETRGRSRDRQAAPVERTSPGLLNHPPDRENAPSRSRHRQDERERERERDRRRAAEGREEGQISPSWSRNTSPPATGAGTAPSPLRRGRDAPSRSSPVSPPRAQHEDHRRAKEQVGRVLA